MSCPKLLLVDSNRLSREGLSVILKSGGIDVVKEVSDLEDISVQDFDNLNADVVLIDCGSDNEKNQADLTYLRSMFPDGKIIVISSVDSPTFLTECFSYPIDGLISKNVSSQVLIKSLNLALEGERIFPSDLVALLLANQRVVKAPPDLSPRGRQGALLSDREVEIVQCLVGGDSNKAIANRLNVSEATVKVHLKSILRKIHVRNRTQAAIWAINNGLADLNPHNP